MKWRFGDQIKREVELEHSDHECSRADLCSSCFSKFSNIVQKSKQLVLNSLFQNGTFSQTKQQALDFLHFRFTFLMACNNEPSKTALFHC